MDRKRKVIPFEIKEINEEERSFLAVGSTEDIDRDHDRILADGWDLANFKKNPVIPWAHRYMDPPVAQAVEVYVADGRLMFRPKFATREEYDFADTIYRLYKGKYLNAFLVGFHPIRSERVERTINGQKKSGYDFLENELWEVSACTVPSNPNALAEAKQKGVISPGEFEGLWTSGGSAGAGSLTKDEKDLFKKYIRVFIDKKIGKLIEKRFKYHLGIVD